MTNAEIVDLTHQHLVNVYGCLPVALARGEGTYLYDVEGKRYLDFFCGLAVTSLGHCHPAVVDAIKRQAETLIHVSNVFHTEPMARLAAKLSESFHQAKVFFCNSGAEANEAAIKLARRWGSAQSEGRFEIIAMHNSFHGRTLATLSVTGQEKYHQGFLPLLPGVKLVPFDDVSAVESALSGRTVAIMVEPIQGEGGVVVPHPNYLAALRALCDRHRLLLIFDEVQVGVGRTGRLYAHQHAGVRPDIMTLAKALGGGLPIGAMLARPEVAECLSPGSHGTTFGGNPVACAAALAVMETIEREGLLENGRTLGNYLMEGLRALDRAGDTIREVRGQGMIIGAALARDPRPVVEDCLRQGLILNATAGNVMRLLPPLNLTRAQADAGLEMIGRALAATSQ
ncbi:MAG TPA: acetylornithine transaminase [Candidatus Binataceae bacterium]|nr:acetylornithine transaminase [Candidatus Binataceae bacterium]